MSFKCPECGAEKTGIIDTRPVRRGSSNGVSRRRRCLVTSCGHRFSTREVIDGNIDVGMSKNNISIAIERAKTTASFDKYLLGVVEKIVMAIKSRR
jgi:transcriptional regulator NrdR family protein